MQAHLTFDHPFLTEREQQDWVFALQRHLYKTEAEYGQQLSSVSSQAYEWIYEYVKMGY